MSIDTKEQILDAAEKLFAEHGIEAVSLRSIISEAGVNLAAIHYHFGSRESLVEAVFERRVGPVNEERIVLLDELEARGGPIEIEDVLRALFGPAIRLSQDTHRGQTFLRICGRFFAEPGDSMRPMFESLFREVIERFTGAFHRALPHLTLTEVFWRTHFAVGAMVHTMLDSRRLMQISGGLCDTGNTDEVIDRMVQFAAAGFKAPVNREANKEVNEKAVSEKPSSEAQVEVEAGGGA